MNEITIVGNLTANPVYRVSERNQRGVVRFDVAVNRRRFDRDKNDYIDLPTVYHRIVTFGPLADNINESLTLEDKRSWWLGTSLMTVMRRTGRSGDSRCSRPRWLPLVCGSQQQK